MVDDRNKISEIKLGRVQNTIKANEQLVLSFKIVGLIRIQFIQKNWERSYDKHDNFFRIKIITQVRIAEKVIHHKFIRKAIFFWTRNPKIPHRIWITIMKDEKSYYPLTEDEARDQFFDFNKIIEVNGKDLMTGENQVRVKIDVSWGKHFNTQATDISGQSEKITIIKSE